MEEVRSGRRAWTILDVLHRESLDKLLAKYAHHRPERGRQGPHQPRLAPAEALARCRGRACTRLKTRYIIGTLSNGNVGLLTRMAKNGGLPWDVVLGAETARAYKPLPQAYLASAELLNLEPGAGDAGGRPQRRPRRRRRGRPAHRLRRPARPSTARTRSVDFKADRDWDVVTDSFTGLAKAMGC